MSTERFSGPFARGKLELGVRSYNAPTLRLAQFELDRSRPQKYDPPSVGGLDLNSSSSGCACLGSGVAPPLGVVESEVAVLIVLVRRHRRAVGISPFPAFIFRENFR